MSGAPTSDETRADRIARRRRTIPTVLGAAAGAWLALPLAVPGAVAVDLWHRRWRLPTLRLYGVALQYLWNEVVEIVLAPVLWVAAGFGTRLGSPASIERHARIQRWSLRTFSRRAEQLLGLRFDVEGREHLVPLPAIVLSRHVNLFDATLPAWLYQADADRRVLGVVMRDLLSDPGFDVVYQRIGWVFVLRDQSPTARDAIRAMAARLGDDGVGVIFPEGRLHRPELVEPLLTRLAGTDPARAERLASLRHVLPPRPGGVLAMLEGAPDADVVVVTHRGFEDVASLARLREIAPLRHPIEVRIRRIPRSEIPADRDGQVRWLDELWLELDREIAAGLRGVPPTS
jgi:1-acyl-sn-glycerol-3-phosphate acyltransferase